MCIRNQKLSLFYKIIAAFICFYGQLIYVVNTGFSGWFYYTNQSNILCMIYFLLAAIYIGSKMRKAKEPIVFLPRFKGAIIMAITVTMLIYWVLLHSGDFSMDGDGPRTMWNIMYTPIPNHIVHTIVPLLMIFDWVLFDPKGSFKKVDPLIWLIIPYVYFIFAIIVAQTGYTYYGSSRYPYFFIDFDIYGFGGVMLNLVVLTGFFIALGYIVVLIDWFLGKLRRNTY